MKKIVGYARLSTQEQAQGQTLEQQIDKLKEAGAEEVFYDLASGSERELRKRKQFLIMLDKVEGGEIEKIISTRMDRFSRSTKYLLEMITKLQDKEVELEFLQTPIQGLNSASGILQFSMLSIVSQFETDMLSDRIKAGYEFKRKSNQAVTSSAPFGYKIIQSKYVLDENPFIFFDKEESIYKYWDESCILDFNNKILSRSDLAREVIEIYMNKKSAQGSFNLLFQKYKVLRNKEKDSFNGAGLCNWLRNPVLRGDTPYWKSLKRGQKCYRSYVTSNDYTVMRDTHPEEALISREEAEIVDAILNSNKKEHYGGVGNKSFYAGLIYCGECGTKLNTRSSGKNMPHGLNPRRYYFCRNSLCSEFGKRKAIREDYLDSKVAMEIHSLCCQVQLDPSLIENEIQESTISKSILQIENRLARSIALLKNDPDDIELIRTIENYKKSLKEEREKTKDDNFWDKSPQEIILNPYMKEIGFIYCLSNDLRKLIYRKIIQAVFISSQEIKEIKFNIKIKDV